MCTFVKCFKHVATAIAAYELTSWKVFDITFHQNCWIFDKFIYHSFILIKPIPPDESIIMMMRNLIVFNWFWYFIDNDDENVEKQKPKTLN